jgi:hypothetical protein
MPNNDENETLHRLAYGVSELDPFNMQPSGCVFCGTKSPHTHDPRCLWKWAVDLRWRSPGGNP